MIFDKGVNHFPKTAISIRLKGYGWLERRAGKKIKVIEIEKDFFDKFFCSWFFAVGYFNSGSSNIFS